MTWTKVTLTLIEYGQSHAEETETSIRGCQEAFRDYIPELIEHLKTSDDFGDFEMVAGLAYQPEKEGDEVKAVWRVRRSACRSEERGLEEW